MKVSELGISFIKSFEKCYLHTYIDDVGIATIGWGNTWYADKRHVSIGDRSLTQAEADTLFLLILSVFEKSITNLIYGRNINQNQFDALVSFAYNVGLANLKGSTLLKKVLANSIDESIESEFLKWNKGGGKILNGLTKRRLAEANIYFKNIYVNHI